MEATSFLKRPLENINTISWNINSIKTKLEKNHVESMLINYDIICLNEVKTNLPVFFPGYTSYVSCDIENYNRGGTCVFVKNSLNSYVFDVDNNTVDQVWFKLKCVPEVLFGACYIPPSDSEYFNYANLSKIQERLKINRCNNGCFIIGDMNCRLGQSVKEFSGALGYRAYSYPVVTDPIPTSNDNATAMLGVCVEEKLLVVNNLRTSNEHFMRKKTFRRGGEWISELDTCFVSETLVKYIEHFDVIDRECLPSDHAPITVSLQPPSLCLDTLAARAGDLGEHSAEYTQAMTSAVGILIVMYFCQSLPK